MTTQAPGFDNTFDNTFDNAFDYAKQIDDPVREDLVLAHRQAWARLAEPGTWWDGRERGAIAAEARAAAYCAFCRKRREALGYYAFTRRRHDLKF
jgi:hypothetical protein